MWLMHLKTKGVIIVFFHHTGKTTGTASGSNLAQRLVMHIILKDYLKAQFTIIGVQFPFTLINLETLVDHVQNHLCCYAIARSMDKI